MIKLKHILVIIILTLQFSTSLYGQDPVYSAFFENPLYYSPAAPGLVSGNKFNLNFREQWPGIPASNRAFNFSSMHSFCGLFSLGFQASSNIEGESRLLTNNFAFAIAAPISISRRVLISSGIKAAYGQKRIDWSKVEFDDQFDKLYGKIYDTDFPFPDDNRKNYGDLSIGIAVKSILYKKQGTALIGTFGIGLNHVVVFPNPNFIGTDINAVPLKQDYFFDIWLLRGRNKSDGFALSSIYEKQGSIETFNMSFRYILNSMYVLTGFRNKNYKISFKKYDSFILGVGYIFNKQWSNDNVKVGYSYDFTVSKLSGGTFGSHELYIVYSIGNCNSLGKSKRSKARRKKKHILGECQAMEFNPAGLFLKR